MHGVVNGYVYVNGVAIPTLDARPGPASIRRMDDARVAPVAGQLLNRRWVYRTLREVYLEPGGVVAKRFVHHRGRRDWRRVWQREHAALERLSGLPVPRSLGYGMHNGGEGREIILRKEYLAGEPVAAVGEREAVDMARLLAAIHERGVVTGDPSRENFLRRPDGGPAALQASRARHAISSPFDSLRMLSFRYWLWRKRNTPVNPPAC